MAKKDLAGLVGGIIGKPATSAAAQHSPATPAKSVETDVKPKEEETRATFVCHPEQIRKLKYIALASGRLHKQVVAEAFDAFISVWESEHGTIVLPPAK